MSFEFHVSRAARDRYRFDETLFSLRGNVVFADFAAARRFAQQMNAQRDLAADPGSAARAGDINAMGLIDEILHFVVDQYRHERNPTAISGALAHLTERLGPEALDRTLVAFAEEFPAVAAYRGDVAPAEYLAGSTDGVPNREIVLEELLMVWLANGNRAFEPYRELFDDQPLAEASAYQSAIDALQSHFREQPGFGPDDEDLVTLLRRPALEAPDSLTEQLRWINERWGFAAEKFGERVVVSLDVLTEEERAVWMRFHATQGGAMDAGADATDSAALHGFVDDYAGGGADAGAEIEQFSPDLDWMPRVVLLAKSTYVWLDQLSRAHGRPIWRLDQIPDEELDRIASRGFTGLWLIGLWERSQASRTIKQMRGNPEAVASAYSLMDYRIADDLGGDEAYRDLRDRAWQRGIRLASDMVPNHMGIDSRWVVEHPDWFMQRPDAPYPAYSYSGPNLSSDERVGIYIEDHYFDNSDAAVTFKRVDRWNGQERHIYHGNDGTSMPWNDTAQLDYLRADVREAVIQTILHVARQFPIIRFDAAMTLAKRHIQRLWYPEPGSAGAIPSRAEYSMSKREFDRAMPEEFWREVVDRVAAEAPDTLLLAEAFWLMEGYFVRTLGMHRVYNSAFMNMMRDEKNAEYRLVIRNTLEFDPQILKRYVNFMNNPDEKTAVDQFGKGDKYFGVATLLATMPGLPMFGHGQVEGLAERYGMEYRRAYLDETPDAELVARHEREIFPLLHRRHLFAEVDNFALYDFVTDDGTVNEDVFAYSNRRDGERSLVVFHNRFAETRGRLRTAVVTGRSLADGLRLSGGPDDYLVMRDERTGLSHLRSQRELADEGLRLELHAYSCQVYLELRDVHDTDGRVGRLAAWLAGRGAPSLEDAVRDMELAPLHDAVRRLWAARSTDTFNDAEADFNRELAALGGQIDATFATRNWFTGESPSVGGWSHERIRDELSEESVILARAWSFASGIESAVNTRKDLAKGQWLDRWRLRPLLAWVIRDMNLGPMQDQFDEIMPSVIAALLRGVHVGVPRAKEGPLDLSFLSDPDIQAAIGVNEQDGTAWFNRERFIRTVEWLVVPELEKDNSWPRQSAAMNTVERLVQAAERSGYRLDALEKELAEPPKWASTRPAKPPPRPTKQLVPSARPRGGQKAASSAPPASPSVTAAKTPIKTPAASTAKPTTPPKPAKK